MKYDRGLGFVEGLLLGGIVGAAVVLLMAPASGEDTRDQIRSEGIALGHRGQQFGDDKIAQAQKMVKQGQKGVADAQTRLGNALDDQKDNLRDALGVEH